MRIDNSKNSEATKQTRVAPVAPQATRELHSGDTDTQTLEAIVMPELGEALTDDLRENVQESLGAHSNAGYLQELSFMEEPVTIRIEPPQEENAPLTVECWVNGRGAEILRNGRWQEMGFLPVGVVITTKRKYLEVLARARTMKVNTPEHSVHDANPDNNLRRRNVRLNSFSVITDANPRGAAWLTQIFSELH